MEPLRVGVNALYLIPGGVGGTEIYLRCLLQALAEIDSVNEYVIFANRETGFGLAPPQPNFATVQQPVRAAIRPARILWEQVRLPVEIRRHRIDVLFNPGFTSPAFCPCPTVTVFHDLQHKRHPEFFRWFDLPFWRLLLWLSARRSTRLVADSESTLDDLMKFYGTRAEEIRLVPLGVEETFFGIGRTRTETEPFLLAVSTLHPHKNFDRLVRAFAAFQRTRPEFRLVIAGLRGFQAEAIERLIADLGRADSIRLTGWIPREELIDLYRRCRAFISATLFEGFGLPVLEALAAGIPAACSSIEPLKSIAGDAALWFDPNDETAIYDAMVQITSDEPLRTRLAAAGPERAAQFTWRKCAEATLEVIRQAAADRSESSS